MIHPLVDRGGVIGCCLSPTVSGGEHVTIESFAGLVQSPERLRLLLVLTVCDIRAVGPNVWNGWKAALLRPL